MPVKTKYLFDNVKFTSKKKVDDYIREIKNKIINEENILIIKPDDKYFSFLMEIVNNHVFKEDKIGCGIKHFYFVLDCYKHYQLRIERTDNSNIDISCL